MVSRSLVFKINKRFDSLIWLPVVRYLYTKRGDIIGYLRGNKSRLVKRERRRSRLPFSLQGFQLYELTKCFLTCLNEIVEYSLCDHINLNEFNTLLI